MRLRDNDTGRWISFAEYIEREGEGITIESTRKSAETEYEPIPVEYDEQPDEYTEYEFDDQEIYP